MAKKLRKDAKTGHIQPNDWEAWREEHVSEYRTTEHSIHCKHCLRWIKESGYYPHERRCRECHSIRCLAYSKKRKKKAYMRRYHREWRKRQKDKDD